MEEEEFKKTNINVACVIKIDMEDVSEFKNSLLDIVKLHNGDIIYHKVSPYKLIVKEDNH